MGSSRRAQSAPRRAGHCCAAIGAVRSRATDGVIRANEKTDAFQPAFRPIKSSRLRYRDGLTSIRRFIARDKCPLDVDAEKCGILGLDTLLATVTDTASDASAAQRLQSFPLPFEHGRLALGKLGGEPCSSRGARCRTDQRSPVTWSAPPCLMMTFMIFRSPTVSLDSPQLTSASTRVGLESQARCPPEQGQLGHRRSISRPP